MKREVAEKPAINEQFSNLQRLRKQSPMRILRRYPSVDISVATQLKIREEEPLGRIPSVISILSGPRRTLTPQFLKRFPRLRTLLEQIRK